MPGEQRVEVRGDHLLERDEARARRHRDEAREERRHLDAREPLLAGAGVAHDDREVERQARDVRERVRGVDGERREHREDPVVELARELGARGRRRDRSSRRTRRRPPAARAATSLVNTAAWQGHELFDARADRAQLLDLVDALGRRRADAGLELLLQARHAHLEELVEVGAEDREELRALEQRQRGVLGEREHARVELEPGELAVEVAGRAGRGVVGARVHGRMVGGSPPRRAGTERRVRIRPMPDGRPGSLWSRTHGPDSSRRRSRRSRGWRSPMRSASRATCSSRCRWPTRCSSARRRSAGAPEGAALPVADAGAVRARRAGVRPADRPHPGRPAPDVRGDDGRAGRAVPDHGRARATATRCTRSRSGRSCSRRRRA